ncbi:MAG TPA: tellurite resistance/C4-dicarboxylate transporter family protein [Solirubrobacterales bacterium]|nr:tellurite resistance/C4-dicarboxylate transporter family protein [Solirubrobacterales bacterium]
MASSGIFLLASVPARCQGSLIGVMVALKNAIRTLYPGYFALIMATGIISNGFYLLDVKPISNALLVVDSAAFLVLIPMTFARVFMFPKQIWDDLVNPRLVFSFFTIVAGANVFGVQLLLRGHVTLAVALWCLSLAVWIPLSYFSFSVLTFRDTDQNVGVVGGGWLIAIVGAESIATLGGKLSAEVSSQADLIFVVSHSFWGIGILLYLIFVTLFAYRIFFFRVTAEEMNPLFWVVMGAAAITVNAGSAMMIAEDQIGYLSNMKPFVDGISLVFWAWATWLIPLLVIFGVWRHVVMKAPLEYSPMYWSLVFPLGMYTVASWQLAAADEFTFMKQIPEATIWIAFLAWLIVMTGLIRSILRGLRSRA